MAITHDDLSRRRFQSTEISSRLALFLVIFSVLCGLTTFILCLTAEGSRSEVTWLLMTSPNNNEYKCFYSGSGRTPLACTISAFIMLAVAMFTEHAYMLVAVTNPQPPSLVAWAAPHLPHDPRFTSTSRDLTWQACCLFLTTWVFFAIAEVLLMIGIGVESGHLSNWTTPRSNCHTMRPGVFAVSGVFGLITVFLGVGLYLTALRTQKMHLEEENARNSHTPYAYTQYPHLPPSTQGFPHATIPQQQEKTSTSA